MIGSELRGSLATSTGESELRRRSELRNGVKFLKGRSESVRQAPHRSSLKFVVLRREIEFVDSARQVFRDFQIPFDEGAVDRQLCRCCR